MLRDNGKKRVKRLKSCFLGNLSNMFYLLRRSYPEGKGKEAATSSNGQKPSF